MKITDPRWNAYCDAWSAIRAISDFCPRCADELEKTAQGMDLAPLEQWQKLVDDARNTYRLVISSVSWGTCPCGHLQSTKIDIAPPTVNP